MDKRIKRRWTVLALEALIVFPLLALGLILSPWFIISAVFVWFAFVIYQSFILPGGPW